MTEISEEKKSAYIEIKERSFTRIIFAVLFILLPFIFIITYYESQVINYNTDIFDIHKDIMKFAYYKFAWGMLIFLNTVLGIIFFIKRCSNCKTKVKRKTKICPNCNATLARNLRESLSEKDKQDLEGVTKSWSFNLAIFTSLIPFLGIILYFVFGYYSLKKINKSKFAKLLRKTLAIGIIVVLANIFLCTVWLSSGWIIENYYINFRRQHVGEFNHDGKEHGKWIFYLPNGAKNIEGEYNNGKKQGVWTTWDINGKLWTQETFVDGVKEGKELYYYENGNIFSIQEYKDDLKNGEFSFWYDTGAKGAIGQYINDKQTGQHISWYENGQIKAEGNYSDDKRDGKWTEWYENGNKKEEALYKEGLLYDKWTSWYENGQKKEEGYFNKGSKATQSYYRKSPVFGKVKTWKYWDENGQLKKEEIYNDKRVLIKRTRYKDGKAIEK